MFTLYHLKFDTHLCIHMLHSFFKYYAFKYYSAPKRRRQLNKPYIYPLLTLQNGDQSERLNQGTN